MKKSRVKTLFVQKLPARYPTRKPRMIKTKGRIKKRA